MTLSPSILYVVCLAGTAVFLFLAGWATFTHRRAARRYSSYVKRMPKAVEYEQVDAMVRERKDELEHLIREAAGADETLRRKLEAEQWLIENQARLERVRADRENHQRLAEQLQELQKQNEEQRSQFAKLKVNVEFLEGKIKHAETHEQEAAKRLEGIKSREETALDELQSLEEKVRAARRGLEQLQLQQDCLSSEISQTVGRAQQEHEELRKKLESQLNDRKAELLKQIEDLNAQKLKAEQHVAESRRQAQQEHEELRKKLESQLNDRKAELLKQIEDLNAQKLKADQIFAESRQQAQQEFEGLRNKLEQQVNDRRSELESVVASFAAQKQAIEQALAEVRTQEAAERSRLEATKADLMRLNAEAEGQQSRIKDLREDIARLHTEYSQLSQATGRKPDNDAQRTAELWQPVFNLRVTPIKHADEAGKLSEVESYLQGQGLRFHSRVVRAFHTSLKTADISPLVVLAGISGTGKSELPKRYAEAMGMHYLCLPVQPRWDSPQDMFGFFNYLENRFRSTELARALVQMDPFYKSEDRGWNPPEGWAQYSLRDQMLLVLLDEMNLARVEYYFSEFLSRLETRRGIHKDDANDRRKAEIVLETGASGQGSPTMRLFVDTNVLFVGTMNEDESTQTLSDKVVDRSNVLRFGRPRNLTQDTKFSPNGSAELLKRRLAYTAWQGWLQNDDSIESNANEKVNRWIATLNESLAKIHRPFAHRTNQSIRSYVANYPRVDEENWLSHAFADQIEQKILPKFRGIDIEEAASRAALEDVKKIVRELGDAELEDAIAGSIHDHQFVWTGADRAIMDEEPAR